MNDLVNRGGCAVSVLTVCVLIMLSGCSSVSRHDARYHGIGNIVRIVDEVADSGLSAAAVSNFADVDKAYRSEARISIVSGSLSVPPLSRNLDVISYHLKYLDRGGEVGRVDVEFDLRAGKCHSIDYFTYNFSAIVRMGVHGDVSYPGRYRGFNVVATPDSRGQGCISELSIFR